MTTHEASTDWEEIGFHRPLGGFFLALFLGLVLFVPLIIYQNLILPVYILPSAQALGIWGRVTQFFNVVWTFFDMGTSAAFIKFMAQYRVNDPRRGIQFGQVFVWWQALSGAVQVAIMVGLAGTVLPHTAYAIYAWSIIIHTFIQIPGFYQVMRHALTGLQRFDYAQILDLALALVFPMLTQPILVSLMVVWGKTQPAFGASMGGLLGLGLAAYAAEALTFVLGLWLYRRLGYNARLYFLAHFDWSVMKDSFRFGVFEMLGSAVWGVGQSLEILITQTYLVNYAEVWGNWVLAQNFVYGFNVINTLYNDLMPCISEAISHGRRVLGQYYSAMAYKWGGLISAMLGAILLAVADRFILGASGPEFVRAAAYSVPLIIWGAIQYPSWVGDNVQRGANKPGLMVVMVGHGAGPADRAGPGAAAVPADQRPDRGLLRRPADQRHRGLFCQRPPMFPAALLRLAVAGGAPAGGGGSLCGAALGGRVNLAGAGRPDQQRDHVLGGDPAVLIRCMRSSTRCLAAGMTPRWPRCAAPSGCARSCGPLAWLFWAASDLGARISPLHGRFPIGIYAAALAEAGSLKQERIEL